MRNKAELIGINPEAQVGVVVSDIVRAMKNDMQFAETAQENTEYWQRLFRPHVRSNRSVEMQPEGNLADRDIWHEIPAVTQNGRVIGVHQPNWGRNTIDPSPEISRRSLDESIAAMELADQLGADYYVVHFMSKDDWDRSRNSQFSLAANSMLQLLAHHRKNDLKVRVCVENLEFPKYPTDYEETLRLLSLFKQAYPNLGLVLDVAHDWHNHVWLMTENKDDQDLTANYPNHLSEYLNAIESAHPGSIQAFHLAQGYIRFNRYKDNTHVTHGAPGRLDGQPILGQSYDFTAPEGFNGVWMDVGEVLRSIKNWSVMHQKETVQMILEVHERGSIQMEQMSKQIEAYWAGI